MDKSALATIINYNLEMNRLRNQEGSKVTDELNDFLGSFAEKIKPLQESDPRDHAYITSGAKMGLMSTLAILGSSSSSMTVVDQIRVLEAGFTGRGPFASVDFPIYTPVSEDGKFLAACYHLVMNHAGNTNASANHYLLAVSIAGFVGGKPFDDLMTNLKETEQSGGQSRIDAVDYLVREMPLNPMFNNDTAVTLSDNGGLMRCLELKINLNDLLHKMIENLRGSAASLTDHAKIHALCDRINGHLYSSLKIDRTTHQHNVKELLTLALDLNKGSERLLDESSGIHNITLTANQVVKIASFSNKQDHMMKSWISRGGFEDDDLKDAVQRLDASVQYQVIDRLELKGLYSPRELNLITGRRLEREMGL